MRKRCICGVILSDTIVPNRVVYWTYSVLEEAKLRQTFMNKDYPEIKQFAVWYCEQCKRFYHWQAWKVYTYGLMGTSGEGTTLEWSDLENVYYSFNDFEDDEIRGHYEKTGEVRFPRRVLVVDGGNDIWVDSRGWLKRYELEETQILEERKDTGET